MSNSDEPTDRLISYSERTIAKSLLVVLQSVAIGGEIPDSPEFREVLFGLEGFIPEVLEEIDQNWSEIASDGILPFLVHKIGERTIKFFGELFTLPPQPDARLYVRLQVDPAGERVNWFECKLGLETRREGRGRYRSHGERMAVIYSSDGHEDSTDWTYMVTFGTRAE